MTPEEVTRAIALFEDGRSIRYIANVLGVARNTVHDAIKRYQETGEYSRRPGSGRPRATNNRDDRVIVLTMLRDRTSSSTVIAHRLQTIRGVAVSALTVRRRLQEYGVHSRRPATAPDLKPCHRRDRLNFAREYAHWTDEDWASVLFTDESRFCLRSADGRQRVWRRPGERYSPCTMSFRTPFNGGSVMVWAGISLNYRTELIIIGGRSLNSDRYITDCLMDHVVPFAPIIGENFLLMHDNAPPHVSRVARTFLQDVEINTLDWPARSPDLNPIEHVWDKLGRRIRQRAHVPETLEDVKTALQEEWEAIDQEEISALIRSMPRRLRAVIASGGRNTKY